MDHWVETDSGTRRNSISARPLRRVVNAQDKGEAEGGIIYGYMYTMNNSDYGFKGDDLEFKSTEEIAAFDANGQVKNTYVVYKQA